MTEVPLVVEIACADHGYEFCAIVSDVSNDTPILGFTYLAPGQDRTAPSWVSAEKACYRRWDGSAGA